MHLNHIWIDLNDSWTINADSFLMALRRFIACRLKAAELVFDQGSNFRGGDKILQDGLNLFLCPGMFSG